MPVETLHFPEDLGTSTNMMHWMNINAYPAGTNQSDLAVSLFIPGGPQNGSLSWKTVNDYAEVSMTKLGPSAIAIGNFAAQTLDAAAINPKVEVLFRTTQLRQFQFNFMFSPSSENESNKAKDIIKKLRGHAAPDLGNNDPMSPYTGGIQSQAQYLTSGLYMKAPSEFKIEFFKGNRVNEHLPKIGRSIIERIDVDYTPQGEYSTFSNGHPVSMMLTVVFREMRIIAKNNILQGGF